MKRSEYLKTSGLDTSCLILPSILLKNKSIKLISLLNTKPADEANNIHRNFESL